MHRTFLGYAVLEWLPASVFPLLVGLFVVRLV
jgi:hypothetical protein